MLFTVKVSGNQLKLEIHPKDTEGSHRLDMPTKSTILILLSRLHGPSFSVSHSVSILSLQTSFYVQRYSCNSSLKRHGSPQVNDSSSGLQFQLLWRRKLIGWFPQAPHSHTGKKEGGGEGHCYRTCSVPSTGLLVPRLAQCMLKCQPGYLLLSESSFLSPLFHLLSLHPGPRELQIFFTLIPISNSSRAIKINPKFLKVQRKSWQRNQYESYVC